MYKGLAISTLAIIIASCSQVTQSAMRCQGNEKVTNIDSETGFSEKENSVIHAVHFTINKNELISIVIDGESEYKDGKSEYVGSDWSFEDGVYARTSKEVHPGLGGDYVQIDTRSDVFSYRQSVSVEIAGGRLTNIVSATLPCQRITQN